MTSELFPFTFEDEVTMLARLALAALVGGIIGIERRHPDRPAGVRTLALTAMGAAAFTLVSIHGFGDESPTRDPARVAAQVATGVGFIGAGTIIRYGGSVRGLTTATAIWLAASLGMAAGAGMYVLSLGGAVLAAAVLYLLPRRPGEDAEHEHF